MTGPVKTGLVYTKYTRSYNGIYLQLCMYYAKAVSFIEFLMDFCMYDDILRTILITDKKLLHFKLSKLGQVLCVDKTGFPRPGQFQILKKHPNITNIISVNSSFPKKW